MKGVKPEVELLSNSSLSPKLILRVDFVFPLSQQEEEEEPHKCNDCAMIVQWLCTDCADDCVMIVQ